MKSINDYLLEANKYLAKKIKPTSKGYIRRPAVFQALSDVPRVAMSSLAIIPTTLLRFPITAIKERSVKKGAIAARGEFTFHASNIQRGFYNGFANLAKDIGVLLPKKAKTKINEWCIRGYITSTMNPAYMATNALVSAGLDYNPISKSIGYTNVLTSRLTGADHLNQFSEIYATKSSHDSGYRFNSRAFKALEENNTKDKKIHEIIKQLQKYIDKTDKGVVNYSFMSTIETLKLLDVQLTGKTSDFEKKELRSQVDKIYKQVQENAKFCQMMETLLASPAFQKANADFELKNKQEAKLDDPRTTFAAKNKRVLTLIDSMPEDKREEFFQSMIKSRTFSRPEIESLRKQITKEIEHLKTEHETKGFNIISSIPDMVEKASVFISYSIQDPALYKIYKNMIKGKTAENFTPEQVNVAKKIRECDKLLQHDFKNDKLKELQTQIRQIIGSEKFTSSLIGALNETRTQAHDGVSEELTKIIEKLKNLQKLEKELECKDKEVTKQAKKSIDEEISKLKFQKISGLSDEQMSDLKSSFNTEDIVNRQRTVTKLLEDARNEQDTPSNPSDLLDDDDISGVDEVDIYTKELAQIERTLQDSHSFLLDKVLTHYEALFQAKIMPLGADLSNKIMTEIIKKGNNAHDLAPMLEHKEDLKAKLVELCKPFENEIKMTLEAEIRVLQQQLAGLHEMPKFLGIKLNDKTTEILNEQIKLVNDEITKKFAQLNNPKLALSAVAEGIRLNADFNKMVIDQNKVLLDQGIGRSAPILMSTASPSTLGTSPQRLSISPPLGQKQDEVDPQPKVREKKAF